MIVYERKVADDCLGIMGYQKSGRSHFFDTQGCTFTRIPFHLFMEQFMRLIDRIAGLIDAQPTENIFIHRREDHG